MADMNRILESTSLIAALVNAAMAVAIVVRARTLRMGFPPLVVLLLLYFFVRAVDRLAGPHGLTGYSPTLNATADIASIVLLVAMFFASGHLVNNMMRSQDEARYRAREYDRARRDYTKVVRHRIMNPLTVIEGAALTLSAENKLDGKVRKDLLRAIVESSQLLKQVTLEPEQAGAEEHDLHALPDV